MTIKKKSPHEVMIISLVGVEGVEPTRPCGHTILSRARKPVPPHALILNFQFPFHFTWSGCREFCSLRLAVRGATLRILARSDSPSRALQFPFHFTWSGCRELNPVYLLPKQAYYRYTTPRLCRGRESDPLRKDFQSFALPLSYLGTITNYYKKKHG